MRQRPGGVWCVVSMFVVLAACGGGGGTTAPTPTPTSISITSSGSTMSLGQVETFSATLMFNTGTTQPLTGGTWGTDAPGVATVNASTGLVTAVSRGDVTIFVDAQGLRGSKRISVTSSFTGVWSGTYSITNCTQTGDFAAVNLCGLVVVGSIAPVVFNLTQAGQTVTGQVSLGSLVSSQFSTTVAANGSLAFTAVHTDSTLRISQAWQVNATPTGQLAGSVVQTWTDSTATGQMVLSGTLLSVSKTSSDPARGLLPGAGARSWSDAVAAITGR